MSPAPVPPVPPDDLTVTAARATLSDVVAAANHGGRRTALRRHGRVVAAVVPAADLLRLQALDRTAAAERARARALSVHLTFLAADLDAHEVWHTLTEQTLLQLWWPGVVVIDHVGMPIGGVEPVDTVLLRVDHPHHLELSWTEPGWTGGSTLRFTMHPEPSGTTVAVDHDGLPDEAAVARLGSDWRRRVAAWQELLAARRPAPWFP